MSAIRFIALGGLFLTLGATSQVQAQGISRQPQSTTRGAPGGSAISAEDAFFAKYPDALLYKGLYLLEEGRHLEAAETWERYLGVAPAGTDTASVILVIEEAFGRAFPDWLVYRGWALFESHDFSGAQRVWTRYLEIAPADADRESVRRLIAEARARQAVAGQ